jgi:CubicO group peptidase (beta-lactamase class C family)
MSGPAMADQQWTVAKLNDGRALHYGFGVFRGDYKGIPEVYHSGATAGYRAFLTYYPSARVSVAVLCNAGNANPRNSRVVSDLYLVIASGRMRHTPLLRRRRDNRRSARRDAYRPAGRCRVHRGI